MAMPIATLDEILESVRNGTRPKEVARLHGVTERYIRDRMDAAGRSVEYRNAVLACEAVNVRQVDVEGLMERADRGLTFNLACVDMGYPRATATRRLMDEGRMGEFYIRSCAAIRGQKVPSVDSTAYFDSPRTVLVSLIPKLSEDDAERLRRAIEEMDRTIRDGATLSRMCGGGSR